MNDDGGRQADEGAAEEAVQHTKHDNARHGFRRDQTQDQDAGDGGAWNNHIQRAGLIGKEVRNNTAKHTGAVED